MTTLPASGLAVFAAVVLAGCASSDSSDSGSTSSGSSANDPASAIITENDFEGTWPFTVNRGVLRCSGARDSGAVTFEASGRVYAVNGIAKADFPGVEPIWKEDPSIPGARVNIGDVLQRGLDLCPAG